MTKQVTVRLPPELLARAKRKAAAEGRTLTSLIEDGLRLVVAKRGKPAKRMGVVLPVSKGEGGLRPGIDLRRLSDFQEMEDLEYVERMKRHFK
jgi:hypothetical protein